jgi:hypothetical protein
MTGATLLLKRHALLFHGLFKQTVNVSWHAMSNDGKTTERWIRRGCGTKAVRNFIWSTIPVFASFMSSLPAWSSKTRDLPYKLLLLSRDKAGVICSFKVPDGWYWKNPGCSSIARSSAFPSDRSTVHQAQDPVAAAHPRPRLHISERQSQLPGTGAYTNPKHELVRTLTQSMNWCVH